MDNYFFNLIGEEEDLQDIKTYLAIPFNHLNEAKTKIYKLNCHEHTENILNEFQFLQENLENFIKQYLLLSIHDRNTILFPDTQLTYKEYLLDLLSTTCFKIYDLEQELHADFPDDFNEPSNWPHSISFENKYFTKNIEEKIIVNEKNTQKTKSKIHIKDFYFGFLFLIPAFIWFLVIPYLDNLSYKNNINQNVQLDKDRSYKNLIYLYSAIKNNPEKQYNFYSLIKHDHFRIPEGFTLVDKNSLADYYEKHYYEYKLNENNISSLSLDNLNFFQCKYILTKIINMEEDIRINNKNILFESEPCSKSNSNSVLILIKSIDNK